MKDYLSSTGDAISPMFNSIRDNYEKIFQLKIDIHHWVHLENYIKGNDHNGYGPRNYEEWIKDMGEEPTVDSVLFWRGKLEDMLIARNETINILCSSILMIAQNGIKLVVGKPSIWRAHESTLLSSQQECLLNAIWHGRNLGAHVEGLSENTPSYRYFSGLKERRDIDLLSNSCDHPCQVIVKDLLGWIDTHDLKINDTIHTEVWPSPYIQDMERIGGLA